MTVAVSIPSTPADVSPRWLSTVLHTEVRTAATTPIGIDQIGARPGVTRSGPTFPASMPKPEPDSAKGFGDIAVMAADITLGRLGDRMSAENRDTMRAAMAVVTPWLHAEPDRFAVLHGDYRLDNMLFDPDRTRVTVVDWQTLGSGLPARDLSYFIATSLQPDARAAVEADLVDEYHRALQSHGVTGYDRESCWYDYRLGMLQAPLITALGCAFTTSPERGDDMMVAMAERGCQAIRELGTLELVSKL